MPPSGAAASKPSPDTYSEDRPPRQPVTWTNARTCDALLPTPRPSRDDNNQSESQSPTSAGLGRSLDTSLPLRCTAALPPLDLVRSDIWCGLDPRPPWVNRECILLKRHTILRQQDAIPRIRRCRDALVVCAVSVCVGALVLSERRDTPAPNDIATYLPTDWCRKRKNRGGRFCKQIWSQELTSWYQAVEAFARPAR